MVNRFVLNETSYHGAGAIKSIADEAKGRAFKKAFVCSDPDLVKFGVTQKVLDVLEGAGLDYELYSNIKPNPTIENVQTGVAACKAAGADYIIAIGGGSSMDTAKGVGIIMENPDFADVRSLEGVADTKHKSMPIFAVPTTFTITYKSENGSLQTTNPVTYTCETEDITLAAPSREGSTFLGWTGTDLAGTTKNVTIKKGSFGDRIYTAVWNNESRTVQQEVFILPKVLVKGKAVQKLSWNKIDGADGYVIYSSVAGKKMKKVLDTRKRSSKKKAKKSTAKSTRSKTITRTFKKRKSGTVYQYQIRAYKLVNGRKKVFCKSMVVYSVANNQSGKLTNVKKIKLKKKSYILQVKQTAKIKAKYTAYKKNKKLYSRVKTFRYISSNTNVATVTKAGKIKAVKAGTCTIYVLAHNGVRKAVKVTVR